MTAIERLLSDWYEQTGAVGAAACLVTQEGVSWSAGIGYADLKRQEPMDPEHSIMNIASVSKLITATAVMQLVETDRLDLDADLGSYLSFEVKHPFYPNQAITARQLLSHTAAIADGTAYWSSFAPGDPTTELGEWLNRYFNPEGNLPLPEERWHLATSPGKQHKYSNVGFGLLGHLVEIVSGINFRSYTKEYIFDPLGMSSSGWFLADIDSSRLACIYAERSDYYAALAAESSSTDRWLRLAPYGFPNYPDGLLRTTIADLSRFASAMIQGKSGKTSILKPATLEKMCTGLVPTAYPGLSQGLGWLQESTIKYPSAWGHDGCDPGVRTRMVVDFKLGCGGIFFTNCSIDVPDTEGILTAIENYAP